MVSVGLEGFVEVAILACYKQAVLTEKQQRFNNLEKFFALHIEYLFSTL